MVMGELLEQLRLDKGMTQDEVGKILHVTKSAVYGYECGRSLPPLDSFKTLTELFNVNADFLLGRTNIQETWEDFTHKIRALDKSISVQDFIVKINSLSPQNRAIILKLVDALLLEERHSE